MMHSVTSPNGGTPSLHPCEARHIRNRLQANIVSAAGGKPPPLPWRPEGATLKRKKVAKFSFWF